MKNKLQQLITIPFIICLLLLLANDFYFKNAFHNWFTGKLSDFTGLFVFSFFWSVLFPKHKLHIHFLTGIIFTWWKSPLANSFISFFSEYLFPIYRVVDISDLFALVVLPLSYRYQPKQIITNYSFSKIITVIVIFSFLATSYKSAVNYTPSQYLLLQKTSKDSIQNDSLTIVEIPFIYLSKPPNIKDDYYDAQITKELEIYYLKRKDRYSYSRNKEYYIEQFDSLKVPGFYDTIINKEKKQVHLSFYDSKLHGKYQEYINNNLYISGYYKHALKDSIWIYYDSVHGKVKQQKYYKNGELFKEQKFNNTQQTETKFSTRADLITGKYFHLLLLLLCILFSTVLIYESYKTPKESQNKINFFVVIFTIPILSILFSELIALCIPNTLNIFFIKKILLKVVFYILIITLFAITYTIKLTKEIQILLYSVLLAFLIVFVQELLQLSFLLN